MAAPAGDIVQNFRTQCKRQERPRVETLVDPAIRHPQMLESRQVCSSLAGGPEGVAARLIRLTDSWEGPPAAWHVLKT